VIDAFGSGFSSPVKSNLIFDLLISDQLDVQNRLSINCVFPYIFDLQLRDVPFVDSPSTEPTLCQRDLRDILAVIIRLRYC